jgi:hypothetical protein
MVLSIRHVEREGFRVDAFSAGDLTSLQPRSHFVLDHPTSIANLFVIRP